MRTTGSLALAVVVALCVSSVARGATVPIAWKVGGVGNWNDPNRWDLGRVPGSGANWDIATIGSGSAVLNDASGDWHNQDGNLARLVVSGTGQMIVQSGGVLYTWGMGSEDADITGQGKITVEAGGQFHIFDWANNPTDGKGGYMYLKSGNTEANLGLEITGGYTRVSDGIDLINGTMRISGGWLGAGLDLAYVTSTTTVAYGNVYVRGGQIGCSTAEQADPNYRSYLTVGHMLHGTALFDMSDGNAHFRTIDVANGTGQGMGTMRVAGGHITSYGSFTMGRSGGKGEVIQTGGDVAILGTASNFYVGFDNATEANYTISGGSFDLLETTSLGIVVGRADANTRALFHVLGSGATKINSNEDFILQADGTLKCTVDAGGVTKITVGDDITLYGTLDMDLAPGYTPFQNQVFDLISNNESADKLDANAARGFHLDPGDTTAWAYQVTDNGASGKVFQAVYLLPEPGTLVFVGAGAVALIVRRCRRRRS